MQYLKYVLRGFVPRVPHQGEIVLNQNDDSNNITNIFKKFSTYYRSLVENERYFPRRSQPKLTETYGTDLQHVHCMTCRNIEMTTSCLPVIHPIHSSQGLLTATVRYGAATVRLQYIRICRVVLNPYENCSM